MNHKYQNPSMSIKAIYGKDNGRVRLFGGGVFCLILTLMILIACLCVNIEGKAIQQNKKSLKLFKGSALSASLIELRYKRDTFANEHQPQPSFVRDTNVYHEDVNAEEDYDYYENDDNYDVIPDMKSGDGYQPNVGDQISEKAKEIAESFTQMWQSLTDSIRHCLNAVGKLFDDDNDEEYNGEPNTDEQEEQFRIAMEDYYRVKAMQDNEVLMNA